MNYRDYFVSMWPEEAVGYFKDGQFYPIENTAEDKLNDCHFSGEVLIEEPDVIIHSHPRTTENWQIDVRIPTYDDLHWQLQCNVEFAICEVTETECKEPVYWGNPYHRPSLEKREFIYGVQDCLSFVQDWYFVNYGIEIPNHARSIDWDHEGETYMDDLYKKWGFVEVDEYQYGDVVMFKMLLSPTTNHLGIYMGDGTVLWHCEGQIPTRVELGRHKKRIARVVRHRSKI